MGGREVGGLANMLAAHMGFSDADRDRVRRFWNAPNLVSGEGLKTVDMFDAIAGGRIKALWVMGTNPAVSLPRADAVRDALSKLDLLVVSENVAGNDTVRHAHIRLPAAAWGEKDGTVTNSERRISRQRAFLPLPGNARPDWWILCEIARRMGFGPAFAFNAASEVFDEHARLSAFENQGARAFDISGVAGAAGGNFDDLLPFQWPLRENSVPTKRLFANGGFFTRDGMARFVAIDPPRLSAAVTADWPFVLNTGRIRDQWHTMTRTGLSPRLLTHIAEPFVEIHPGDAAQLGLEQGTLAHLSTAHGSAILRVLVHRGQQPGSLFVPIHWSGENSSSGRVGALVQRITDPFSGQPESKGTPARIVGCAASHFGFLLTRQYMVPGDLMYWAAARTSFGHVINFALNRPPMGWDAWMRTTLPDGDLIRLDDAGGGTHRAAVLRKGRLEAVVFVGSGPKMPSAEWLKSCFDMLAIPAADRRSLLSGRPMEGSADEGPIVCVCFQVGAKRIQAEASCSPCNVETIGRKLGAGTNCGSCIPEIKRLITAAENAPA
jgi:assimilatory nitrate reductase catalytic subunit